MRFFLVLMLVVGCAAPIPGPQGEQGPEGLPGAQGTQGVQGIQGQTGVQGVQGPAAKGMALFDSNNVLVGQLVHSGTGFNGVFIEDANCLATVDWSNNLVRGFTETSVEFTQANCQGVPAMSLTHQLFPVGCIQYGPTDAYRAKQPIVPQLMTVESVLSITMQMNGTLQVTCSNSGRQITAIALETITLSMKIGPFSLAQR